MNHPPKIKIPLTIPSVSRTATRAVQEVFKSKRFIKGSWTKTFEENFAKYSQTKYGGSTSSGTTAIYIALRALGISAGDEVLVPSHTFVASASPILFVGAKPVFVEVDETYTIDLEDAKKKVTKNTKAIIAVHLYGQLCDMNPLMAFAKENGLFVIEDAAQAHGATYAGKKAGSFGDISCFSFFPSKNLTVCGDGGMALTNNEEYYSRLLMLRDHGRDFAKPQGKYNSELLTLNFRQSELEAAIGIENLKCLNKWTRQRQKIAQIYDKHLPFEIQKPIIRKNCEHVFHLYVVQTEKRDELSNFLRKQGIETGVHYPIPLHHQTIFKSRFSSLPYTDKISKRILSLPLFPDLSADNIKHVCEETEQFVELFANKRLASQIKTL